MKILYYPEVFRLFENDTITIDLDERVFANKSPMQVLELDQRMKEAVLNENYLSTQPEFQSSREIKLHSSVKPSLYHTFRGSHLCCRHRIEKIPLLQKISTSDKTLFAFVELSDELVKLGFSLVNGGLVNMKTHPVDSLLIVNTERWLTGIPDDTHVGNLYFVSMT